MTIRLCRRTALVSNAACLLGSLLGYDMWSELRAWSGGASDWLSRYTRAVGFLMLVRIVCALGYVSWGRCGTSMFRLLALMVVNIVRGCLVSASLIDFSAADA